MAEQEIIALAEGNASSSGALDAPPPRGLRSQQVNEGSKRVHETYSAVNSSEAETVASSYTALDSRAEALAKLLPANQQNAFYELVLFPVKASANLNEMYAATARNTLYAQQGRVSANKYADLARRDYAKDGELMKYYNTVFAGGE